MATQLAAWWTGISFALIVAFCLAIEVNTWRHIRRMERNRK